MLQKYNLNGIVLCIILLESQYFYQNECQKWWLYPYGTVEGTRADKQG